MKKRCLLLFLILSAVTGFEKSHAQVANDDCFGAQNLGTLGAPAPCPNGLGPVSTFNNLTNINSVTEQPYTTLINCQPSNNTPMASPATDVWFSFVNNGNQLNITINGGIVNPNIAVYQGTCNGLIGRGCALGTGNTLTTSFDQMVIGQTYYIQISGGSPADQGNFTLTLQNENSCNDCLLSSNLTVNPLPTNGTYQGGTTVTFCYTITQWDQQNTNWLHAVIPTFGSGWDMSTLTNLQGAVTCDGGPGVWQWFNNVNTPNGNGIMSGFFFDGDIVQGGPNGNPTDNFGDNCNGVVNWTFCWTITAKTCPPGQNGDDLGIIIDTYGDGETGNWTNIACVGDPVFQFNSQLTCCQLPQTLQVNILCNGGNNGSATVTAQGTGPYNYVWVNSSNVTIQTNTGVTGSSTVNNMAAGTYTVTITDTNDGCITTATVTITEPPALQLTMSSTPANCGNNNGSATCTPQGGVGPYQYQWDANAGNQTTSTATNLGQGLYQLTVTDANGCTSTAAVNVSSSSNVTAQMANTATSCSNTCNGTGTVTVNGGTAPYVYLWDPAANNQNTATATNLCAGTFTVTYTDANGCTGTETVTITSPPAVTVAINAPANICIGQQSALTGTAGGGSGSGYTYNWLPVGTGNTQTVNVSPAVTTNYTLTVTDGNGCTGQQTVTVTVYPPLNIQAAGNPSPICLGQQTTLNAIGGGGNGGPYVYTWAPAGTGNGASVSVTPAVTTTYTVTIDDGCTTPTQTAVVTIVVNPLPTVQFSANPVSGCAPLNATFTNLSSPANNPTCIWDFGDGTPLVFNCNPSHIYNQVGCFDVTLTYTDDNGCAAVLTMPNYVCTFASAVADFTASPQPTTIFNPTVNFTDLSLNTTIWDWYFGIPTLGTSQVQNPSYTFITEAGDCYDVVLVANNVNNCPDSDTMEVCIDPEFTVYFPNAFTPNGDSKNDGFTGSGIGIKKFELWIFDRWGNMIYYTDDINKPWDGKVMGKSGEICQQDVYVWKAGVTDIFDKKHKYIGHVTLIK